MSRYKSQYTIPESFYSWYRPTRMMTNPIQFWVRGKINEYGHLADHAEFITIDASEKDDFLNYINKFFIKNKAGTANIVLNGKTLYGARMGDDYIQFKDLGGAIIAWHLNRVSEFPLLKQNLNEYLRIFTAHSRTSLASFWKTPGEPLKGVQKALIEAITALADIKETDEGSVLQYSKVMVKKVNLILDELKTKIANLATNPVLHRGDLGETLKQFAKAFDIKLPEIGLSSHLTSAAETVRLTISSC